MEDRSEDIHTYTFRSSLRHGAAANLDQLAFEPPRCPCGAAYTALLQTAGPERAHLECSEEHMVLVTPLQSAIVSALPCVVEITVMSKRQADEL